MDELATIDVGPLLTDPDGDAARHVAFQIDAACRDLGFFRIAGHGVTGRAELERLARQFFEQPDAVKARWAMTHGGRAWRGWFGVGGELTAGVPDRKEGLYFGTELPPDDPRVVARTPLHGPNQFPDDAWRTSVLDWMTHMADLGHAVLGGVAMALGLERSWFRDHLTAEPTVLLRVFHYPPADGEHRAGWGVAEHTDYGLLTLLAQDGTGGLEVHTPRGWLDVPADPDVLVCNLGDMLERLTGGAYRSTPHRVRNATGTGRISIPCFIDPSWDAVVPSLPIGTGEATPDAPTRARARWDGADPRAWPGTYGEYLTAKVAKVFPDLFTAT